LIVSEKQISQNGTGIVRNSCVSSAPNLYVIKGGHKVGSNLCGFLFGYCIGRILLTGLKDVFQSAAIFSLRLGIETVRATAPEGAARW
jgi:hypothetical protein